MIKSNDSKFQKKQSTIKKQTQSITPRILSKAKIDQKLLKEKKSEIKNSVKNRQTISPKENIKKKSSQTFVKPFNKVSTNILGTSNGALPTNYTDKEEEKKNRQTVICNNNINFKDEMKLRYLGNLFRTSNLKKTIIIDSDGNNNLNLNKNIFIEKSNENQNKDLNKKENKKIPPSKQLKNENDIRLIEYDFIFDLLNTNIEEMKDMFKKKSIKPKESSDNIFKKTPKKKIIQIFSEKDKEEINNIKPLLSPFEMSHNNENNSFLESCIQDDFYQSILNKPQTNSYHSFEMSSVINNNVNTSSNLNTINTNKTECELEDNTQIEDKVLKISEINPHFLVEKKYKKKSLENIGKNQNSKSTKNLSGITNKCSIF